MADAPQTPPETPARTNRFVGGPDDVRLLSAEEASEFEPFDDETEDSVPPEDQPISDKV